MATARWVDVVIPASWPLGEPQFGLAAAATIAAVLVVRRSYRAAAVVFGGFVVLSAVQLAMVVTLAVVRHDGLGVAALVRLYPSGHAARVPFLGTALAAVAPGPARWWILRFPTEDRRPRPSRSESLSQFDPVRLRWQEQQSRLASLWFVTLFSAWKAQSLRAETHQEGSQIGR